MLYWCCFLRCKTKREINTKISLPWVHKQRSSWENTQHPFSTLQWRHNEGDGVSNHWCIDCLLNCLFSHRSKKTSKLCVTGLCEGNSPVTRELPAQRASNAKNVSIWWRHHEWHNELINDHLHTSTLCLTFSVYILVMTSQLIAQCIMG